MNHQLNLDPYFRLPSFRPTGTMIFEQGDTAHNYYTILYCTKGLNIPFMLSVKEADAQLFSQDGWPRRSPNTWKWYGRQNRCSRDLLTPVLIYQARYGEKFWPLFFTMAKRLFLFANNTIRNHVYETRKEHLEKSTPDVQWRPDFKMPDVLGPDIWSIVLRGFLLKSPLSLGYLLCLPIYISLCVLDLHILGSALIRLIQPETDQRNQALKTHFSSTVFPTPLSALAMKIYKQTNPCKAFEAWWSKPGEPRVDYFMRDLYK